MEFFISIWKVDSSRVIAPRPRGVYDFLLRTLCKTVQNGPVEPTDKQCNGHVPSSKNEQKDGSFFMFLEIPLNCHGKCLFFKELTSPTVGSTPCFSLLGFVSLIPGSNQLHLFIQATAENEKSSKIPKDLCHKWSKCTLEFQNVEQFCF